MEILPFTAAELPEVLSLFADKLGGPAYRDRAIGGFVLTREIYPLHEGCESYVKFAVKRKLATAESPDSGVQYFFEEGTKTNVDQFSIDVIAALAAEEVKLTEEDEPLWEETVDVISYAIQDGCDNRLLVATRSMRYGTDDVKLLDIPMIGGVPIFVELEDMDPPADLLPTFDSQDVMVLELVQPGGVLTAPKTDELESFLASFETNRAEELVQRMVGMMSMIMAA
jgi:hypothetical protein